MKKIVVLIITLVLGFLPVCAKVDRADADYLKHKKHFAIMNPLAENIAEILGCRLSSVSVAIEEVSEDEWKEKVWDAQILPEMDALYKKPGYVCE